MAIYIDFKDEEIDTCLVHRAGFKQQYWDGVSIHDALRYAQLFATSPKLLNAVLDLLQDWELITDCSDNTIKLRNAYHKRLQALVIEATTKPSFQ